MPGGDHRRTRFASGVDEPGDEELATDVRAWEARWVALLAEMLEAAGANRPAEAARRLLNLVRDFELERLLDDRLTRSDFDRRLELVLADLPS